MLKWVNRIASAAFVLVVSLLAQVVRAETAANAFGVVEAEGVRIGDGDVIHFANATSATPVRVTARTGWRVNGQKEISFVRSANESGSLHLVSVLMEAVSPLWRNARSIGGTSPRFILSVGLRLDGDGGRRQDSARKSVVALLRLRHLIKGKTCGLADMKELVKGHAAEFRKEEVRKWKSLFDSSNREIRKNAGMVFSLLLDQERPLAASLEEEKLFRLRQASQWVQDASAP